MPGRAQSWFELSDSARISVLTCSPGKAVWSLYGHTAIRVKDPLNRCDIVLNYGLFNFDSPHFVWRFCTGQTDYLMGASSLRSFLREYREQGRGVTEQVLNLSPAEKGRLWHSLYVNLLPENRTYRYNFFYDNCATRPRLKVEECLQDTLLYNVEPWFGTMRDVLAHYNDPASWGWFGISMLLGSPADRPASLTDQMFAPELMMDALANASKGGQPLVAETHNLLECRPAALAGFPIPSPILVFWILLAVVLGLSLWNRHRHKADFWLDGVVFGLYGLVGIVLFFLTFFSAHPATDGNWLLLWLHPLQLVFALCLCFRGFRQGRLRRAYLGLQGLLTLTAIAGLWLLPQFFHPACLPMLLILLCRCALGQHRD